MIEFDFRSNIKAIERKLSDLAWKQVPFATAQAINSVSAQIIEAEKKNEVAVLDRPRPFTTGAVRMVRANKSTLSATIFMMDKTANYLAPYQFGGSNALNSKALLKPVDAVKDLDQYGNIPRNFLQKLKGRKDIFIGPVKTKAGIVNGVWQRAADETGMTTQTRVTRSGKVITRKVAGYVPQSRAGRTLKLLIKFTDAHRVRQNLDWFGVAQRVLARNFNKEFGRALGRAIRSAK